MRDKDNIIIKTIIVTASLTWLAWFVVASETMGKIAERLLYG